MTNPVTFTPTLAQFRAAANQRNADLKEGQDASLRFKANGTGFAVSPADRFLVRVADFFSFAETVAQRKAAVLTAFLAAARTEHSEIIETLSKDALSTGGGPAKKLSARAILALQRNAPLQNELAIRKAAYGVPDLPGSAPSSYRTATPALAEIVAPVAEELLLCEPAPSDLLTEDDLDGLRCKYVGNTPKPAHHPSTEAIFKLSQKIEAELRIVVKENPTRTLAPDTILREGKSAVRSALTREINHIAYKRHCAAHPFAEEFGAAIKASVQKHKIAVNMDILLSKKMLMEFEHIEKAMVRNSAWILNLQEMTDLRAKLAADVVSHQAAIARIEAFKLPPSAEKTEILLACLDIAPKRLSSYPSANGYFACVEEFAKNIDDFIEELGFQDLPLDPSDPVPDARPSPSLQQAAAAFDRLDGKLWRYLVETGNAEAAAIDDFVTMGINLFAARATPETLAALGQHLRTDAANTIIEKIRSNAFGGDGKASEEEIRSASRLNRVIHLMSRIAESRDPSAAM